jgi:hypothetical protein
VGLLLSCSGGNDDNGGEATRDGNGSLDAANLALATLSLSLSLSFSFDFLRVGLTPPFLSSRGEGEGEDDCSSSSFIPGMEGAGGRASRGGELELGCGCVTRGLAVVRGGDGEDGEERPEGMLNECLRSARCLLRLEVCVFSTANP